MAFAIDQEHLPAVLTWHSMTDAEFAASCSRRSPDASLTLEARVQQLDSAAREGFWHLSPDFVI